MIRGVKHSIIAQNHLIENIKVLVTSCLVFEIVGYTCSAMSKNDHALRYPFLVWDVDGTLFDSYPTISHALYLALIDFGVEIPVAQLKQMAQYSLDRSFQQLEEQYGMGRDLLVERFRYYYYQIPPVDQPLFPGVLEVCQLACQSGGNNYIFTHRKKDSLQRLLDFHGMEDLFASQVTRDSGYPLKPDPAGLLAILQQHDLPAGKVLMIGDREIDIQAGRNAGVHTCLYGDLKLQVSADYHFTDYQQLSALLTNDH